MRNTAIDTAYAPAVRAALVSALILLVPLTAMKFTDEVVWDLVDFVVAGSLLFGAGLAFQLIGRKSPSFGYRAAIGIATAAAVLLIWANLAVGLIGAEGNIANLMYVGVLAVAVIGAISVRFQARGMTLVLLMTASTQALITAIALIFGLGYPYSRPLEILLTNGFFVLLFVVSAWLFSRAARSESLSGHL